MAAETTVLQLTEGASDKFYEVKLVGTTVFLRWGRRMTAGKSEPPKSFPTREAAVGFVAKTIKEKMKKGYYHGDDGCGATGNIGAGGPVATPTAASNSNSAALAATEPAAPAAKAAAKGKKRPLEAEANENNTESVEAVLPKKGRAAAGTAAASKAKKAESVTAAAAGAAAAKAAAPSKAAAAPKVPAAAAAGPDALAVGQMVEVQGSASVPYRVKRVSEDVYSCTCAGWTMNVHKKSAEACSCKHIREVIGGAADDARLSKAAPSASAAGPKATKGKASSAAAAGAGAGDDDGASSSAGATTNSAIVKKVSLAQAWSDKVDPTGYVMSEKLDGMRAYWSGGKLWTRTGNVIHAPAWFTASLDPAVELDGELFMGRGRFQECVGITRRHDASAEWAKIQYVIFDAPMAGGGILARLEAAAKAVSASPAGGAGSAAVPTGTFAIVHPHSVCTGHSHLLEELALVQALGGEGMMLRKAAAVHRGGRSADLLKVKDFKDDEAIVVKHEEGEGRHQGRVGALVCKARNGKMFKVGSGFTDEQRAFNKAPKAGTVITYKFFELTTDGIPRFPTFLRVRPDVDASEFE